MAHKNTFGVKLFLLSFFAVFLVSLVFTFSFSSFAFASETNGTIDATYKYAWGENIGWINFGCDNCDVAITDTAVTGNAWSTQFGWINLDPTNAAGVTNTSAGVLGGYAWSSNLGWINFTGVTIGTTGEFSGYATLDSDSSQISFNCSNGSSCGSADFKVKTDWRPASARTVASSGGSSGSVPRLIQQIVVTPVTSVINTISDTITSASDYLADSLSNFFKPKDKFAIVEVPKVAPPSFGARWDLLPVETINAFVFAPLPYEVRTLANKFPELGKTFKDVGIDRLSDIGKLSGVTFNIKGLTELEKTIKDVGVEKLADIDKLNGVTLSVPGLSDVGGGMAGDIGTGKIALIKGLPVAKFSVTAKKNLPTEFVFARTHNELVDLNVALSISEAGQVTQKISSLPSEMLRFVIKPISRARSVTGYFVFKSATPKIVATEIPRSSLIASALFSMDGLVENAPSAVPVERKLVLSSFEYTDPDHDGIYTADVASPVTPGEYEVITVIDYVDPVLGVRQIRMVTVIDPEGYVFEKNDGKETRIPSAIVSLYFLNVATKSYELWPAVDYQQENPQITDIRGTYSFLVPEGSYYFKVKAPGYKPYEGKVFIVTEGNGIHQNIELKSSGSWFSKMNPQTIVLIVVLLLLMYNLYRNVLRDKLLKLSNKNNA